MNKAVIISIRNKSSRLPEKSFLHIGLNTSVDFLISRIQSHLHDVRIIIATSDHDEDQIFVKVANRNNVDIFCGSQDDKIDRYYKCCLEFNLDSVIVIDGDDLFVSINLISELLFNKFSNNAVIVYNDNLPIGLAPYFFSFVALDLIMKSKNINNTEVWGEIVANIESINFIIRETPEYFHNFHTYRLTLDYPEDLIIMNYIWNKLGRKIGFSDDELLEVLNTLETNYLKLMVDANNSYKSNIEITKKNQK